MDELERLKAEYAALMQESEEAIEALEAEEDESEDITAEEEQEQPEAPAEPEIDPLFVLVAQTDEEEDPATKQTIQTNTPGAYFVISNTVLRYYDNDLFGLEEVMEQESSPICSFLLKQSYAHRGTRCFASAPVLRIVLKTAIARGMAIYLPPPMRGEMDQHNIAAQLVYEIREALKEAPKLDQMRALRAIHHWQNANEKQLYPSKNIEFAA